MVAGVQVATDLVAKMGLEKDWGQTPRFCNSLPKFKKSQYRRPDPDSPLRVDTFSTMETMIKHARLSK